MVKGRASRAGLQLVDLSLAAGVVVVGGCALLARRRPRHHTVSSGRPRLLAIESIYSLEQMRARGAEHHVTHRDLEGYFEHVWNVHPLVGAHPGSSEESCVGPPTVTPLGGSHTMIEGKVRRFAALRHLPCLDFACAQLQLVLAVDRIVDREGVSIVRGDPYYHGLLALLLGRLNGRPVELRIVGNHDSIYAAAGDLAFPRLFRWRAVEQRVARFTLSRADSVVVYNADNGAFALRNGARAERVTQLANAGMVNPIHLSAPSERQPVADEFGFADRLVVMCVSRLVRTKHPEDVVTSVAKAHRREPRIAAVIVGEGNMRSDLEQLCKELGVEEDVVFAGDRDQRWIARMLTRSTVIAVPLAGLALVESALSGTPVVAYDVEWHSELIRSPQEGLLVPYRDTDAMADAICQLASDPERAATIAAAARERVKEFMQPARLVADERAHADRLLALRRSDGAPSVAGQTVNSR